jgi:hypothetical protein
VLLHEGLSNRAARLLCAHSEPQPTPEGAESQAEEEEQQDEQASIVAQEEAKLQDQTWHGSSVCVRSESVDVGSSALTCCTHCCAVLMHARNECTHPR